MISSYGNMFIEKLVIVNPTTFAYQFVIKNCLQNQIDIFHFCTLDRLSIYLNFKLIYEICYMYGYYLVTRIYILW